MTQSPDLAPEVAFPDPLAEEPEADLAGVIEDLERISGLKGAEYNPRHMPPERLRRLRYSVRRFGDIAGITFNIRTGNLIAAHQRLKALKAEFGDLPIDDHDSVREAIQGFKEPEGWASFTDPHGHRWNVRLVNWSPSMERAANLAANAFTLQGLFSAGLDDILTGLQFDEEEDFSELGLGDLEIEVAEGLDGEESEWNPDAGEETDFNEFPELDLPGLDNTVEFKFGNVRGRVDVRLYKAFLVKFEENKDASGEAMIDGVLRHWLGVDNG